jgi:hypothetical protein
MQDACSFVSGDKKEHAPYPVSIIQAENGSGTEGSVYHC